MSQFRTREEMFPLVERYLEREHTKKAFCAEHGVPESTLTYWVSKYRRQAAPQDGGFVEITPPVGTQPHPHAELIYPHGVRLRLFGTVAPAYLNQLVRLSSELG